MNFDSEPQKLLTSSLKTIWSNPPFRMAVSPRHPLPNSSGALYWLLFPLHLLLGFGQACKWQMDSAGPCGPDAPCLIHEGRSLAVTLHTKGQALAWAKLPRLSSVTFPLYALVCSHSARARCNKSNARVGREDVALLYVRLLPRYLCCLRSRLLWHGWMIEENFCIPWTTKLCFKN